MGVECLYSFWDLFDKAHGRKATDEERATFFLLPHDKRNILIRKWAVLASWEVDERTGTDGKTYTAFAPRFPSK